MKNILTNLSEKHPKHQLIWGKTSEGMGCRKLPEMGQDEKMVRTYKPRNNSERIQKDI